MSITSATRPPDQRTADLQALAAVEQRVLWLATAIVDHANRGPPTPTGLKVGGHQASSASMASIMTSLYFAQLGRDDRVSVKPHASPVLHAINFLLGDLDEQYLTTLRSFGGLQSYPSRSKDPDPVDYSTGSVGIGATATIWGALAHRYVAGHFDVPRGGRQIALLGDAELDEGAVWEAIVDPMVARLGEVLWVVDLNPQPLDRAAPDIAAGRLVGMFEAAGWHTETVKYGRRLRALFERDGGEALAARIDAMGNEEYQRLLRADDEELRERLPGGEQAIARLIADLDPRQLLATFRDLGGHDLEALLAAYRATDAVRDRPSVIFAYTIKGWSLPTEGHPSNHSALLNHEQFVDLAQQLSTDPREPWRAFDPESPEGQLCAAVAARLEREPVERHEPPAVPAELGRQHSGTGSTQQALGRLFVDLDHDAPAVSAHVVTVSPDVASSTNLGGWINRSGIWSIGERIDWFADDSDTPVRRRESAHGAPVRPGRGREPGPGPPGERGIAEVNLVGLLGERGATWSRDGRPLLPVGTIYDPFVARALEPWSFGIYAGGQSILVGTPSGVTLGPEGGAHQSVITPSIGIEQPGCVAWEPAFGQDLEWIFLHALSCLGRPGGTSAYLRLSTRPIDQGSGATGDREARRPAGLAGGYRLRPQDEPAVVIAVMGALVPEAVAAADMLE